jgi:hypothetical protein
MVSVQASSGCSIQLSWTRCGFGTRLASAGANDESMEPEDDELSRACNPALCTGSVLGEGYCESRHTTQDDLNS